MLDDLHCCSCNLVTQSCLTLCDPMDCSPPGSSVRGSLQARILEWVAMPSSRGSSRPRDRTQVSYVSCIVRWADDLRVVLLVMMTQWGSGIRSLLWKGCPGSGRGTGRLAVTEAASGGADQSWGPPGRDWSLYQQMLQGTLWFSFQLPFMSPSKGLVFKCWLLNILA